jgi:hypothetical protein
MRLYNGSNGVSHGFLHAVDGTITSFDATEKSFDSIHAHQ